MTDNRCRDCDKYMSGMCICTMKVAILPCHLFEPKKVRSEAQNIKALQQSAEDMATILLLTYPQYDMLFWSMVGIVFASEAEKKMSKEMRKNWRQAYHNCLDRRVRDITCDEK